MGAPLGFVDGTDVIRFGSFCLVYEGSASERSIMDIKQLWFSFDGRASRSDYWLRTALPIFGVSVVLIILSGAMSGSDEPSPLIFVYFLWSLFSIWPSLAVSIKRLHDRNQTGWWVLIGLIPFFGGLYLLVVVGFLKGTDGDNDFGADPLAGVGAGVA